MFRRALLAAALLAIVTPCLAADNSGSPWIGPWDIVVYRNSDKRVVAFPVIHSRAEPGSATWNAMLARIRSQGLIKPGESMGYSLEGVFTFGDRWRLQSPGDFRAGIGELGGP